MLGHIIRAFTLIAMGIVLTACGGNTGGLFKSNAKVSAKTLESRQVNPLEGPQAVYIGNATPKKGASLFDLFLSPDQNTNVRVNKYLWNASLETLSFLPVESADPFTGILVMGWGRAPGGSRQYRATVLVQDPALDARSLKLSIQTRGGTASAETVRRIEDAIMTRARQLRIRDKNL